MNGRPLTRIDIEDINAVALQDAEDGILLTFNKGAWKTISHGIGMARCKSAGDSLDWLGGYCCIYAPSASDGRAFLRKYSHLVMGKAVHVIGTGEEFNTGRLSAFANELRRDVKDVFVQKLRCVGYRDLASCWDLEHLDTEKFARCMPGGDEVVSSESQRREDAMDFAESSIRVFDRKEFLQENFQMRELAVSTGFPLLDYMTMGLQARETYLIASGSGQGKTTLCLSMAKSLTEHGHPVLMFSMEATFREITAKAVCIGSDYTYTEILNGIRRVKAPGGTSHALRRMSQQELEEVKDLFKRYEGSPMARLLSVRDTADRDDMGEDLSEMQDAMDAWLRKIAGMVGTETVPVVVVDYLQLISIGGDETDSFRADNERIRKLVKMCKERDIVLIVVSSQNKASIRAGSSSQTDVAGTGQNIYCVSVLLQLKRDEAGCSLYVLKNRITGDETRWRNGAPVPGTFEPMLYKGGILVENTAEITKTAQDDYEV